MRTRLAATALAISLGAGGTAGLFLARAASAETGSGSTTAPAAAADRTQARTDKLNSALQGLVDAGTITTAQRDAVVQAIVAAEPAGGKGGRGHGGPGGMPGMRGGGAGLDAAAAALGTDAAGLRALLTDGKTIAQVAADKGVSVDTVIAAVVAAQTAKIDQAVTDGKLTQAQADTAKAGLTERATALVNGTLPAGPKGMGPGGKGGMGGRHHGPDADGDGDAPAAPTTPTTAATGTSA